MDKVQNAILKELLPSEAEVRPPAARSRGPMDHWSSPVVLERAAYLRKIAKLDDGSASETLQEYPRHCVMLSVRLRSGEAEVHERFADLFFVLEGRATLVTGGSVHKARIIAPGEIRGSAVVGGTEQELRAGDAAHVPAGVPHQMLLAGESHLTCMVLKVQEND
jgi:mannose-6-phosphate isomerase-like protein (cupin superfamily)